MKMLNNKGFTVIELVLSFAFVSILSVGMLVVAFDYRSKQKQESIKNDLISLSNSITMDIQDDIFQRFLSSIEYCDTKDNILKCIRFNFKDGTNKELQLKKQRVTIHDEGTSFSYISQYLVYGNIKYDTPDDRFVFFPSDFSIRETNETDKIENNAVLYKVVFPIKHREIEGDFGIKIVASTYLDSSI